MSPNAKAGCEVAPQALAAMLGAMKFLQLNFLPGSADAGLLIARLWFGGSMVLLHGWGKLTNFSAYSGKFADPFGMGQTASLGLTTFAEVVCATFIVLGLFTRLSALILAFNMAVAFKVGHGAKLAGEGNGEVAFLFLGAFLVLLFAGAGKFSVDAKMGAKV
ncbi:MAG: DoxX family protein [Verrucomicrobiota bacterium]